MNVVLWVLQVVLAAAFAGAGSMKLFVAQKQLVDKGMGFAGDVSPGFIKTLGAAELAGAVGVILPAVVNIAPILVPIAASCCALVMLGAVGVHIRRREWSGLVAPVALLCVAVVVAWGRFGPYAF